MALRIIKYLTLFLLLCNMPGYLLLYFGPTYGSVTSYLTSLLLIAYFVLVKSWHKPIFPFLILGILYFTLSGFNYTEVDTTNFFIKEFTRFMIVVVCGVEILHRTKIRDFFFILLIGAASIIVNALVFPETNFKHGLVIGRFSGFYLNPNAAGIICLVGFALSYSTPNKWWRYLGQFVFTLGGILTLSRTFVVVWLLINIVAVFKNKKNIAVPLLGAFVLTLVFTFTDTSIFASNRFAALESFFGNGPIQTKTLQDDSRNQTWALYYDLVFDKPFVGHGFMKFQKHRNGLPGAHNTFLMVIGEAGILPFLLIVVLYGYLLIKSIQYFKDKPELLYVSLVMVLSLMVSHGYFFNFFNVILSIYVYIEINKMNTLLNPINTA